MQSDWLQATDQNVSVWTTDQCIVKRIPDKPVGFLSPDYGFDTPQLVLHGMDDGRRRGRGRSMSNSI